MREIKFRGKCTEEVHTHHEGTEIGQWIYGYLVDKDCITHKMSEEHGGMGSGIIKAMIPVDPETVGQFTGLHDKNGKEIYEGDEIEYDTIYDEFRMPGGTGYWEWQRARDYVVYRVDGFCLDMDSMPLAGIIDINQDMQDDFPFPDGYESGIVVIGNIHDEEPCENSEST